VWNGARRPVSRVQKFVKKGTKSGISNFGLAVVTFGESGSIDSQEQGDG